MNTKSVVYKNNSKSSVINIIFLMFFFLMFLIACCFTCFLALGFFNVLYNSPYS